MPAALAISPGDPAGVGPELIAQAWANRASEDLPPFFSFGGADLLAKAAQARGLDIAIARIDDPSEAAAAFAHGLPVLGDADCTYAPGAPDSDGAQFAFEALGAVTQAALAGNVGAIITGPISKSLLVQAGFDHRGQTEFLAEASGIAHEDAVMMLAGPSLRTIPLTVHVPLAEVPSMLTGDLIVRRARIAAKTLTHDFGIERPRIAVCGLNPHAGEDGRLGTEEQQIIAPAIAKLQAEGLDVTGPHPADSLFAERERATYDAALTIYHDQALIPIKALDFDQGVNVTLGLPFVRTSPDHGTAFAIAGKAVAHPGAMIAAIRMAGECADRRARA